MTTEFDEKRILAALGGVSEENELWRALNALVSGQLHDETLALLAPDLSDSAAHYNRGRVAALIDLQNVFKQMRERAQKPEA
jgi:hypothetical protein